MKNVHYTKEGIDILDLILTSSVSPVSLPAGLSHSNQIFLYRLALSVYKKIILGG